MRPMFATQFRRHIGMTNVFRKSKQALLRYAAPPIASSESVRESELYSGSMIVELLVDE